MRYSTDYKVDAGPFENEDAAEFFEFKAKKAIDEAIEVDIGLIHGSKHTGRYFVKFEVNDAKWYDWEKDLRGLSTAFPDVTIDAVGHGEETGDIWKARIRNGESEIVEAVMSFPDFKVLV